jgi:hypothetical protein
MTRAAATGLSAARHGRGCGTGRRLALLPTRALDQVLMTSTGAGTALQRRHRLTARRTVDNSAAYPDESVARVGSAIDRRQSVIGSLLARLVERVGQRDRRLTNAGAADAAGALADRTAAWHKRPGTIPAATSCYWRLRNEYQPATWPTPSAPPIKSAAPTPP